MTLAGPPLFLAGTVLTYCCVSTVRSSSRTKLSEVRTAIRQQLLQQKKQEEMRKWVDDTGKSFQSKTSYQVGYEPPATTSAVTTTSK